MITKVLVVVSASLWMAALSLAPSAADAKVRSTNCPAFYACGPYFNISNYSCGGSTYVGEHHVNFGSSCAGGCDGADAPDVTAQQAKGRRDRLDSCGTCNGKYTFTMKECSNCSG